MTIVTPHRTRNMKPNHLVGHDRGIKANSGFPIHEKKTFVVINGHYLLCFCASLGNVHLRKKSTYIGDQDSSLSALKNSFTSFNEETIITIKPSFIRYAFEIRFENGLYSIPRALRIYPTLKYRAPIFESTSKGDFDSLVLALRHGNVSPFVQDEYGHSLLHVRVYEFVSTEIDFFIGAAGLS